MTLSRISNTSIVKSVNGDPINSEDEFEVFKDDYDLGIRAASVSGISSGMYYRRFRKGFKENHRLYLLKTTYNKDRILKLSKNIDDLQQEIMIFPAMRDVFLWMLL